MADRGDRPSLGSLDDLEQRVRGLVFAQEPPRLDGVDDEVQALYRRIARNNLFRTVRNAVPITKGLLGDDALDALIARFLDDSPPTTRFLRQVPQAFAAWLHGLEDPPHHPALPELVHFETVEGEVLHAPDAEPRVLPSRPDDEAGIEADPSARLLAFVYPVHGMQKGATAFPAPTREPSFLVAYRAAERFRWVAIPGVLAKTLALTAEGLTLGHAFAALEQETPGTVDRGRLRSLLVDLKHRGALLGFPRGGNP